MAIMKMRMVNIVGPREDFVRISADYISGSNIHLENVFTVLDNVKGMYPYTEDSKASEVFEQADNFMKLAGLDEKTVINSEKYKEFLKSAPFDEEEISRKLKDIESSVKQLRDERAHAYAKLDEYEELRKQLRPIETVNIDLNRLYEFEFIKFRFGKMPVKSYKILDLYLKDMDAFFLKTSEDSEYVWGIYFAPDGMEEKVDVVFASLYFERVRISNNVHGTPRESLKYIDGREQYRREQIAKDEKEIKEILSKETEFIIYARIYCQKLMKLQEIKRFAGHTEDSFYIVGWMSQKDADELEKRMKKEDKTVFLKENPEHVSRVSPPTKLKNFAPFRPFEMFVTMYGLPSYNEFDPTWIFAISYFIMFGAMFGDVGQGLVLFIGGFLFAAIKKSRLGAIIGTVGISSAIFGVVYGSVFGNEEIIKGYNPMEHIMDVLIYAVFWGVGIILFVMLINIIIGIKNKDTRKAIFSQNGIAGLVFYGAAAFTVYSMLLNGGSLRPWIVWVVIISVILIMFQGVFSKLLERKKDWIPKNKGMFILESVFEMFEIVLSFVTNTLSFLRVGAFALNHVGMMGVVKILAEMIGGGSQNIVVLIIGNIVVIGLEGLVVGIQTLRLEFFEMFSRFYSGDGREFKSLNEN